MDTRFEWFGRVVEGLMLFVALFGVGKLIKQKHIRKKYIIYTTIFIGQLLVIVLISAITGVATYNTWLGGVAIIAMSSTLLIFLRNNGKYIKFTTMPIANYLDLIIFMLKLCIIGGGVLFLLDLLGVLNATY